MEQGAIIPLALDTWLFLDQEQEMTNGSGRIFRNLMPLCRVIFLCGSY
jgi:hypothetical protein